MLGPIRLDKPSGPIARGRSQLFKDHCCLPVWRLGV